MERCSISPVVHDGSKGVKRKKFRGEITTTLYWLVSSFLMRDTDPHPVPVGCQLAFAPHLSRRAHRGSQGSSLLGQARTALWVYAVERCETLGIPHHPVPTDTSSAMSTARILGIFSLVWEPHQRMSAECFCVTIAEGGMV